ncbi:peroxisomal membrane protein 4 isoform X1 [Neofelis nebulosa]|uniref:peroxisomal membrane protein 4 isoform X1 n=1 Tax=Neofelis nebulosa TaxID=61452 RepID=UPI00272AFC58|nr:peroxisomal membrane protein 4 isoform X1 [Neofelis nebulosa]
MAVPPQLRALLLAVNALLRKRRYHAALAMVKGFRNGAVYGVKIRAPHALVMTFLFRSGSLQEKLRAILQATYTHSRNLACFVFAYKGLCALQSHVQGETYQVHSFLAAFIGALLVFRDNSNINSQINMYLLSRLLFALCRLGVEKGYIPEPRSAGVSKKTRERKKSQAACSTMANLECAGDAEDHENNLRACDMAGTVPSAFCTLYLTTSRTPSKMSYNIILSP